MKEITVKAVLENFDIVLGFISTELEVNECSAKTQMQIAIAVEEIYVNIAHYAYPAEPGHVTVQCEVGGDPVQAVVRFIDDGVPYNPLEKEDPDITLPAEERDIGGLGIFLVKKSMDHMEYRYRDGKNILMIRKNMTL